MKLILDDKSYNLSIPDARVAYDSCHKIYLTRNPEEEAEAAGYGYELHGVEELPEIWESACPLRYIDLWDVDLHTSIIPQCSGAAVTKDENGEIVIRIVRLGSGITDKCYIESLEGLGYLTPSNS